MKAALSKMESQLRNWSLRIDRLAGAVHGVGTPEEFDALVYIDELKALHAVARSKLDEFKAAKDAEQQQLESGLRNAWSDLEEAIESLDS